MSSFPFIFLLFSNDNFALAFNIDLRDIDEAKSKLLINENDENENNNENKFEEITEYELYENLLSLIQIIRNLSFTVSNEAVDKLKEVIELMK